MAALACSLQRRPGEAPFKDPVFPEKASNPFLFRVSALFKQKIQNRAVPILGSDEECGRSVLASG